MNRIIYLIIFIGIGIGLIYIGLNQNLEQSNIVKYTDLKQKAQVTEIYNVSIINIHNTHKLEREIINGELQ